MITTIQHFPQRFYTLFIICQNGEEETCCNRDNGSSLSEETKVYSREGGNSPKSCTCLLRDQEETLLQIKKEPIAGKFCERIVDNGDPSNHLNEDIRQRDGAIKRIYAETGLIYETQRVF